MSVFNCSYTLQSHVLLIPVCHSGGPLGLTLTLTLTPGMADPRNGDPVWYYLLHHYCHYHVCIVLYCLVQINLDKTQVNFTSCIILRFVKVY